MDQVKFEDLARSLAWQLGELRSETWAAELRSETHGHLDGPGGASLGVHWYAREGKLIAEGMGPDRRTRNGLSKAWQAGVDPQRGLLTIGKDIDRRLISAGYVDDLVVAQAKKAERDAADARRANWLLEVAELFGLDVRPRTRGPGEDPNKVYLGQFVKGSGYVQSYGRGTQDTDYLDINLSGIPAGVALAMLKPLAELARKDTP